MRFMPLVMMLVKMLLNHRRNPENVLAAELYDEVVAKRVPAKPARKGINPFTKEPTVFKAKPARTVVKIRPLKALKDAV